MTRSRGARAKRGIDDGFGTHDRADGIGDILRVRIGDECDLLAEDVSDQRRIYAAERHDHRTVDSHPPHPLTVADVAGSLPNVAAGTAGTCCQVPRSAEAAAAAMTSAT